MMGILKEFNTRLMAARESELIDRICEELGIGYDVCYMSIEKDWHNGKLPVLTVRRLDIDANGYCHVNEHGEAAMIETRRALPVNGELVSAKYCQGDTKSQEAKKLKTLRNGFRVPVE